MIRYSNDHLRFYILLILLLSGISDSYSQLYNFRNYSLDDGLSQSEVNCIYEDSRGYLWIGTSGGGLNRFDGKEFTVYEEKNGLCGQIINAVSEDGEHNILIGTQSDALCKFNGSSFQSISWNNNKELQGGDIQFIVTDDNNNTIIGKSDRILLYNGKQFERLQAKNDTTKFLKVRCFKKDSRNILWIGTNKGLYVLKNRTLLKITEAPGVENADLTSLTEDINGNIWTVENNSLFFKIRIVGPSHYQVNASKVDSIRVPENTMISDIHFDQHNQLWITSINKGLFKFVNNELSNFTQNSGLPVDNLKSIYEDKAGNLWFGTSGGGLVKFTSQAFTYYDNIQGLNQPDIFAINADKKGNIWVGTSLHGLFKYDGRLSVDMTLISGIGYDVEVRCIYTDKKNNTWIGTTKGITIYNGSSFKKYDHPECKNVRAIFEDASGNIWIGTRGKYAFVDNGKETKQITQADGLTNDNVYAFTEDKNGNIWLGTGNGIFVYNDGKIIKHLREGLCNSYAGSMVKDKFGNMWVGTDNCVAYWSGTSFKSIGQEQGLASGTVYLLNGGNLGNIWVGTNKGLDKITLNENGGISSIRNYGKSDGFRGIECNSRSTCIDQEGCLWFGTIKGAIKFDPRQELLRKREAPLVHLNSIKLFYDNKDLKKYSDSVSHWFGLPMNMVLPYNMNHLTFDFSAISKSFPDNMKYSFMLEGFDQDWCPPSEINSATYSNIPPGNYKFMVKAFNKDGVSNENAEEFSFVIAPPFWTTWWFTTICLLSFVAFIYLYNEYRKRKHVLYLERLEKIIKQRTAEIIKQRDENEILLKEVHHRVKNNLQIINSLINIQSDYVNDKKASELFREIRNRIRTISLVHEKLYKSDDYGNINVKEYINMLVENLIDTYSMNKDISLKLDLEVQHFNLNTIIPLGLLLNEVISNAFKYAFNDTDTGAIEISLHKSTIADEYTLIIGDNGVGFKDEVFTAENPTLGLELVKILASQLNGTIQKIQKPGTYYILKFRPLKD